MQDEFETRAQEVASKGVVQSERRFKAEPVSPLEWQRSAMSSLPFSKCHALSLRNTEIGFIQNLKDVACNPCENPCPHNSCCCMIQLGSRTASI